MYTRLVFLLAAMGAHVSAFSQWTITNENGLFGYTHNSTGEVIPHIYENAFEFKGPTALVVNGGQYQLIDKSGNTIANFPYSLVLPIDGSNSYTFQADSSVGVLSETGQIIDEIYFEKIYRWGEYNEGFLLQNGNLMGIFTTRHGLTLPILYETDDFQNTFMYDGNLYFYDSAYFCLKRNNKWGVISMYGDIRVPFEYDQLIQQRNDHIGAYKNGKWGLLDQRTGKTLVDFTYDGYMGRYGSSSHTAPSQNPYIFLKNNKIVFYSLLENKIIPQVPHSKYKWQVPAKLYLTCNGKRGVIDTLGNILVPFNYDNVWDAGIDPISKEQAYTVSSNENCSIILASGKAIFPSTPCEFARVITIMGKPFYVVFKNDKAALFGSDAKPITGYEYDRIDEVENRMMVTSGDKTGILSITGVVTWQK